ncbi:poly(R)-hydroxyalkanoic acid synthase subunit PhaE, partial [Lysobacter sp. A3-1-A15]
AYNALLGEAGQAAFALFQEKLAQRGESGQTLDSARALFDLWIDAAEEAYAEVALSPRFREAYGDMINAQMRLRAAVQGEVEQAGLLLGTPTRTEVDSAHRKIVQLEREMRRLRDRLEAGGDASAGKSAEHPRAHR